MPEGPERLCRLEILAFLEVFPESRAAVLLFSRALFFLYSISC